MQDWKRPAGISLWFFFFFLLHCSCCILKAVRSFVPLFLLKKAIISLASQNYKWISHQFSLVLISLPLYVALAWQNYYTRFWVRSSFSVETRNENASQYQSRIWSSREFTHHLWSAIQNPFEHWYLLLWFIQFLIPSLYPSLTAFVKISALTVRNIFFLLPCTKS